MAVLPRCILGNRARPLQSIAAGVAVLILLAGCGKAELVTTPTPPAGRLELAVLPSPTPTDGSDAIALPAPTPSLSLPSDLEVGPATVGLYSDDGAAEACVTAAGRMFEWMGYTVTRIDADTINHGDLQPMDVLYFPGGSSRPFREDITPEGKEKIRQRVRDGGCFIGTCAGALFAGERVVWEGVEDPGETLALFPGTVEGPIPDILGDPQFGMCQVDLVKPHPITKEKPDSAWILYYNSPFFRPNPGAAVDIVGRYQITNDPALVAFEYGTGRVFLTGPHPEWEEDSDRDGISYFERFDDRGSDWELMRDATRWCLYEID